MIYFITGHVAEKHTDSVVVSTGHIGLQCNITLHTFDKLPAEGSPCRLLTYLHVREDILQLYAFAEEDEREMFFKLISLSGIGPKQAINILSGITHRQLTEYILQGDVAAVKRAPGVGEKYRTPDHP
ncbi:MAG: Holliday junction branch migration protein RuvA [Candidatus Marinimicrobia bacterium]|nr:Holliday junction branch migration protein RuvA [Candidatus Neomarinimicrobiota bacterium]